MTTRDPGGTSATQQGIGDIGFNGNTGTPTANNDGTGGATGFNDDTGGIAANYGAGNFINNDAGGIGAAGG